MPVSPHKVLYIEDDEGDLVRMMDGIDSSLFEIVGEIYGDRALATLDSDKTKRVIRAVLLDAGVLLDPQTQLPQPLQGADVARRVREVRPDLPLFAVSWFRKGGLNVPVDGVYPKATLFVSPATFRDLEEALLDAVSRMEVTSYYPHDSGGSRWRTKWGQEYIEFRNNPNYSFEVPRLGQIARQDYDALADGVIGETYRKYRGTDSLKNVLIARRTVFATVFSHYSSHGGIAWREVSEFLGFKFPEDEVADENSMHEGLRNFMNECGIKWGNIINRSTALTDEEEWLRKEGFIPS
jgi:hypothetical protein